ncbi:MAG: cytochrome C [Gammaproteobacteria bacterium]|nr:cytochrome C [Gammaproteobacteria bacterium]
MKTQNLLSIALSIALSLFFLSACTPERTSGKGLHLPEGNIEDGKATFVNLGCVYCHAIPNVELALPEEDLEPLLLLGGKVQKVKTYGELVTSIVNPQHVISPAYLEKLKEREAGVEVNSIMPTFNDDMTVSQLIDLVTFLDSNYEKLMPQYVSMRHGYGAY